MNITKKELAYKIGPLLYMPANQLNIIDKIKGKTINGLTSIALCLEDSICDDYLKEAEKKLVFILDALKDTSELPYIFVRIRNPQHMADMMEILKPYNHILTGYILPKFDSTNCKEYISVINLLPSSMYVMPILESGAIASILTRREQLISIKRELDTISDRILNVRVGCNDLCNIFGLRRGKNQTIYDIRLVSDVLIDILNVFSSDYVVSGPVFDYFDNGHNDKWSDVFEKEIQLDVSNGFIGKTCIHPSQLNYVIEGLKVSPEDLEDAKRILSWKGDKLAVAGSEEGNRMNEVKCHTRWAEKIVLLSTIYGIKDE